MTDKRNCIHIEAIRIIAAYFVIFNHTGSNGYFLFSSYSPDTVQYWLYLAVSIFCKISVPLFFMITGALLLKEERELSLKDLWLKRMFRIGVDLLLFLFISYLQIIYLKHDSFSIVEFIVKHNWNNSYWFLYAYIGLLIGLPLIKSLSNNFETKWYYYWISFALLIAGIIPVAEFLLWKGSRTINSVSHINWMSINTILYPCVGFFLEHRLEMKGVKKKLVFLWGATAITIGIAAYMTYYKSVITGVLNEYSSQDFHSAFALLHSMTVYVTVRSIFTHYKINPILIRVVRSMGKCTFGIYLIHIMVIRIPLFNEIWDGLNNTLHVNHMLTAFIYSFIIFLVSYFIIFLSRKIPLMKKLI